MTGYVGGDPYASPTFGKSLSLRVDGGVNAVSINPSGRDVVLASRQGLHIIDLDDPFSPPRWLRHVTPWQVADVQWSPHPDKPHWVISTSNQKAIIWNLARSSSNAIEHVLHRHFRAITDINFNRNHPNILATCSIDTYVHAWDMRSPDRPFYTTRDWRSGASQVKWNFDDQNVLASAHGNDVSIWDLRKGSTPLGKLVGHGSSVNSVDFNRFKKTEIMTGSNDGTVKFWDYSVSCTEAKKTIRTDFPIWRGRYLPFGEGCCLMPTVGGNNSVYLASLANAETEDNKDAKLQPIYAFKGHKDRVTDFLWRSRSSFESQVDDREFQLITWSNDCDLRLWPVPEMIYDKVHFERKKKLEEKLPNYEYITYNKEPENDKIVLKNQNNYKKIKETFVTTSGLKSSNDVNHITWLSGVRMNNTSSPENIFSDRVIQNLGEEVSSIGHKFPKIIFEKISVSTGELILTLSGPWSEIHPEEYVFLRIDVEIPPDYPNKGNAPVFTIEENGNLSATQRQELTTQLKAIGEKYTDLGLYCLEPCLRLLLGEKVNLDDINQDDEPLLNFDMVDRIDFENLSSLPSSENSSQYLTDTSSESENGNYKDPFVTDDQRNSKKRSEADLAFDSTPVPNECGAVWSPTGQLLCFFISENRQEKTQQAMLRLTNKDATRQQKRNKSGSQPRRDQELFSEAATDNKTTRPKRYVETINTPLSASGNGHISSDDEPSSEESSDSFGDDWSDILRNEIVVRTKLPAMRGNFSKTFGSVHSGSAKTVDSSRRRKNIIFLRDFSHLIPDRKELALEYDLTDLSLEKVTRNNALVAEKYNLEEISHCWQILSDLLMAKENYDPYDLIWDNHPMGIKWFVKEAILYFEKQNNLQMLAMLCCVVASALFQPETPGEKKKSNFQVNAKKKVESTIRFQANDITGSWRADMRSQYSNTMISTPSEAPGRLRLSPDDISIKSEDYFSRHHNHGSHIAVASPPIPNTMSVGTIARNQQLQARIPNINIQLVHDEVLTAIENPVRHLLDLKDAKKFRYYSFQYAKLLFRWGLPMQRAEMIKISFNTEPKSTSEVTSHLPDEHEDLFSGVSTTWIDNDDKKGTFQNCTYCGLKVTRSIFVCESCEHIMHSSCARTWWLNSEECASGCGCSCPEVFQIL